MRGFKGNPSAMPGSGRSRIAYQRASSYSESAQGTIEGLWYRPRTVRTKSFEPGAGITNPHGDIWFSARGSTRSQLEALYHEKVHQFFSPKFIYGRTARARLGQWAYDNIATIKYLEEALAESIGLSRASLAMARAAAVRPSIGQLAHDVAAGIAFPIRHNYVSLYRLGIEALIGAGATGTAGYYLFSELSDE